MSKPENYVGLTGAAIGRAMAAGALDPVAFAACLLERIEAQTSPVFLRVTRERAMREAGAAQARLAARRPASALDGVPVAWKDLIDMRGETTTAGSNVYRNAPPADRDAPIVASACAAGLVSLGKLNLTEFAYSGLGLNPNFGTPLNPLSKTVARAPGGSSSGSGVAVALGLAPIAVGTDTGGSVRIPAAFNGICGYKPTFGRICSDGVFPLARSLDTVGPLAGSVEDCILTDMVLRGGTLHGVRRIDPTSLHLFVPETIVLDDLEPAVSRAFETSLATLTDVGATVERGPVPELAEIAALSRTLGSLAAADAFAEFGDLIDGPDGARVDRRVTARIEGGRTMSARDVIRLQRARARLGTALKNRLGGHLIAMPTVAHVAPESAPLEADDGAFHRVNVKTLRNTSIGNFLNMPGVAIPNGADAQGLPTSLLLSAWADQDDHVLSAALTLEPILRSSAP